MTRNRGALQIILINVEPGGSVSSIISYRFTLLATGAAFCAVPAMAADDTQRDYLAADIVVTGERDGYAAEDGSSATKTPTPLIDVPQAVTVITADQIEDQNVRQLGDALRFVPGVSLGTGEGHRDQVLLRGQSTTADFFVDGQRDDAQYYRPLYNVERIEVLKGSNALIFGRGGGGGAINRVMKTADTMAQFVSGAASVDTFGAFSVQTDVNQPLADNVALRINGTYEELDNHRALFDGRFFGISPTLTAELGPDTRLTASYTYDDDSRLTDRGVPSLNGRPIEGYDRAFFGSPTFNHSESQAHIARARIDHQFNDAVSVNATLQYADYDKYYGNILPGAATATTVSISGYESANTRENLMGQANLVAEFATGPVNHTLLAGVEAMTQDSTGLRNDVRFGGASSAVVSLAAFAVPAFTLVPNSQSDSSLDTLSAYIQEQIDFGPVQLVAGLRYDRFDLESLNVRNGFAGSRVDEKWSPRLGLIVKPLEEVSLYASYATTFLPQSGDQFNVLSPVTELLVPEKFENRELGIKWAVTPRLFATAALFRLNRSNTQSPDPVNSGQVLLTGETRVEGLELSLAGELTEDLQLSLGYSLLDGEIRSTTTAAPAGRTLQQLPRHQVSGWARYQVTESFGIGLGVVHQSRQFTTVSNAVILPSYTRADAGLFYDISENASLQLNVENLFDANYYPSSHTDNNIQPGEPVNATLGVRLRY
jgi:catecholate siderophore receptor